MGIQCSVSEREAEELALTGDLWILGLCLAIGGCAMSAFGLAAQRHSHVLNLGREVQRGALRQPLNLLGVILMAVGAILDLVAFGFAPQSLLAPLGAVTLVINTITAPLMLKERLTKLDLFSTVLVFAGVTLSIVFGSRATPKYDYDDLMCLYYSVEFAVYGAIITALLATLCICLFKFGRERTIHEISKPKFKFVRLAYPCVAGTFGGGSVLFGKSAMELIKSSIEQKSGENWTGVGAYLIIFGSLFCLFCQVRLLNASLKMFEALFVVPVYQAFWVLINVLGGAFYFRETSRYDLKQWILYPLGIVIMLVGVLALSQRHSETEESLLNLSAKKLQSPPASPGAVAVSPVDFDEKKEKVPLLSAA